VRVGEPRHRRVLVLNDDAPPAESLCRLLRDEDYEARSALDGEAAQQTFPEWPADLIVLDLIMPRVDGWRFPRTPIARGVPCSGTRACVVVGASDELELARNLGTESAWRALRPARTSCWTRSRSCRRRLARPVTVLSAACAH
jgi:CheY-like chemotaxis protein